MLSIKNGARRARRAMTLIEQVFVAALILAGAVVAYFSIVGVEDKGQAAACSAERASIVTAQEVYKSQNGAFAISVDSLVTSGLLTKSTTLHSTDTTGKVTGLGVCA